MEDGAPEQAVTDGEQCLAVTFERAEGGQVNLLRVSKPSHGAWFQALKSSDAEQLSVDVFLPAEATAGAERGDWANFTMRLITSGPNGKTTPRASQNLQLGQDNRFTLTLPFKKDGWDPKTWFAQLTLSVNGKWNAQSKKPDLSPVYLDNFRVGPLPEEE